jgi:hypothetical protein
VEARLQTFLVAVFLENIRTCEGKRMVKSVKIIKVSDDDVIPNICLISG